jgi:hypothetical protein
MIRLVLWLAGIVALAGLFTWLADRPGVLTVDWLGYRIETPVVVAAVALLAVLILINASYGLMRRTWQAPGAVAEFFRSRRNRRGYEALSRGIVAVGAGDLVAGDQAARPARPVPAGEGRRRPGAGAKDCRTGPGAEPRSAVGVGGNAGAAVVRQRLERGGAHARKPATLPPHR